MIHEDLDDITGWSRLTAQCGDMTVQLVPQGGCNVASIRFRGRELLKQAPSLAELAGFRYGVPILYPTPGRIATGEFTFGKRTFHFPADKELGTLHGIACLSAWQVDHADSSANDAAEINCRLPFQPGTQQFDWFPLVHDLRVRIRISPNSIRWQYEVDNSAGDEAVAFGIGLHPWFLYQGSRTDSWLTLRAVEKEELNDGMATGKRLPMEDFGSNAIKRIGIGQRVMDDVFCVLAHHQPTTVEFGAERLTLSLRTSQDFSHLVAYTPADEPWFCIENWTCPPDAHNLHARGLEQPSCLQVVEPGGTRSGWVELVVQ